MSFKEYVTSSAFNLSLSKAMCDAMEFVMCDSISIQKRFRALTAIPQLTTMHSLSRRGLVKHLESKWEFTEAGAALYPLLVMAGLCMAEEDIRAVVAA